MQTTSRSLVLGRINVLNYAKDFWCTNVAEHEINFFDPAPLKESYRNLPTGMFEEVREQL